MGNEQSFNYVNPTDYLGNPINGKLSFPYSYANANIDLSMPFTKSFLEQSIPSKESSKKTYVIVHSCIDIVVNRGSQGERIESNQKVVSGVDTNDQNVHKCIMEMAIEFIRNNPNLSITNPESQKHFSFDSIVNFGWKSNNIVEGIRSSPNIPYKTFMTLSNFFNKISNMGYHVFKLENVDGNERIYFMK